jgi:hypothetical protein
MDDEQAVEEADTEETADESQDVSEQIEALNNNNEKMIGLLEDAGYSLDSFDVLRLRLDTVTAYLVDFGIVDEQALELYWATMLSRSLMGAIHKLDDNNE